MKALDTYLDLCTQVYELSKSTVPEDDYNFYKSYACEAKGSIFEPMCGTGRFLLPLMKDGYKIEGSDASKHMLSVLREKAVKMEIKPEIWQGYANEIPNDKLYSLILIPSGSFGLITDPDEITATLKSFYDHLDDGGIIVFEAETKHAVPQLGIWRGSRWKRADGKMIILSSCASMDDDICSSIAKYELIDGSKIIQTEIEEYKIKIHGAIELLRSLKDIGFKEVKTVKAFDRNAAPDENAESIVYECIK